MTELRASTFYLKKSIIVDRQRCWIAVKQFSRLKTMQTQQYAKNFAGDLTKIPDIRKWITDRLVSHNLSEIMIYDIITAVSEALSNIFRHAYSNELVQPVRIKVVVDKDQVQIVLRDFGKKFDFSNYQAPNLKKASTGGYGIYLIRRLMDSVQYVPREIGTELILCKKIDRFQTY